VNVYYIQMTEKRSNGHHRWMLIETDMPSMKAITDAANAGHLVHGWQLFTKPCPDDEKSREVTGCEEVSLVLGQIRRIGMPRWKLYRLED